MFDVSSPRPWLPPPQKKARTTDRPIVPLNLAFSLLSSQGPGCASVPAFETNLSQQGPPIGPVFNAWPVPFFGRDHLKRASATHHLFSTTPSRTTTLLCLFAGAGRGQKIAPGTTARPVVQLPWALGMCHRNQLWDVLDLFLAESCRLLFLCRAVAESSEQRTTTHSKTKVSPVPNTIP